VTSGVLLPALLVGASVAVVAGLPSPARPIVGRPHPGAPAGAQSGPTWPARSRAAPLGLAVVLLVLAGPVAAGLGLLGAELLTRWWARRTAAGVRAHERAGAAEALAVLSSELRAGRPTALALSVAASVAVGPLADGLAAAAVAGDLGADPVDALLRAAPRSAAPDVLRGLAACWQVCSSTGSSLAAAVERLSVSLRADQAQRLAVASELAGPRATAVMLGLLPLAGIGLAAGLGARPLHVLLHTPAGVGCLVAGLALECLGAWWTARLVAAAGGDR
jgi:tight adherence protein B